VERTMPLGFISEDGYGISNRCRRYLAPLIEGEDPPPFKNGLPAYIRIENKLLKKKLPKFNVR